MSPCTNEIQISKIEDEENADIFMKTPLDDQPGFSQEDREFMSLMEQSMSKTDAGNWIAPLPFRPDKPYLPDNKAQAEQRARSLHKSMLSNETKRQHMFSFMEKVINNGHAERAAPLKNNEDGWYLPLFGVYSKKKPDQIRGVFDSSAKCNGISLNSVLMSGPDLVNSLVGVLLRFRKHEVAITADIEQMFYGFKVDQDHRRYLRFLWYEDNDFCKPLVDYQMTAHVFGNSPSPAVASYGLKKSVEQAEPDVKQFVSRNFYVDDALTSLPDVDSAVSLLQRTQETLKHEGNLRLHKITSNKPEVLTKFQTEDLAKDIKDINLETESPPLQRSLGLYWNISSDSFTFSSDTDRRPFSRRGVLATVNSLYDPIGFAAPVLLKGKLLLRDLFNTTCEWDDPLPDDRHAEWEHWRSSLERLGKVSIPRRYVQLDLPELPDKDVFIFADASKEAISAVAYLKIYDVNGDSKLGFLLGKTKVAPLHGHTIPRLELCAALLATDIAQIIKRELDIPMTNMKFFTDSQVVLGYLYNRTRRFYVYVSNRVDRILNITTPDQWTHVSSSLNPADEGTRGLSAYALQDSCWLNGPSELSIQEEYEHSLVSPDEDKEVRPIVALATSISHQSFSERFENFSSWTTLVKSVAYLKHVAKTFSGETDCRGWHLCKLWKIPNIMKETEQNIIRLVQTESFPQEIKCIQEKRNLPSSSPLKSLSPKLNDDSLLCIGGRLNRGSTLDTAETNPVILPKGHHVTSLIITHHHTKTKHQGRHLTEGAVRAAGYWVIGGKRMIASILHKCIPCRKLRGPLEWQRMGDLPPDRLQPSPPFTYVGLDTFGPWDVVARRTRGGVAHSKRWAILFTCLVSRAVHLEVIEELSTSSFVNALRRFTSLRGPVLQYRSDRGTNFIGAVHELEINEILVEEPVVKTFLCESGSSWLFNTPHSSHMGGAWERLIGVTRRILNTMLMDLPGTRLTHEILTTFLAEVTAIINSRPITSVSSDPESPCVLTPSTLLTQKSANFNESLPEISIQETYKSQWKYVQHLAEMFWAKWRSQYLQNLQVRPKWKDEKPNLKEGDVVLLRDIQSPRFMWPMGLIDRTFQSPDGKVRKVEVAVMSNGKRTKYIRPITECVMLIPAQ